MIVPLQVRAARALLGWTQAELAAKSRVTQRTIALFELGQRLPRDSTMTKVEAALIRAGIVFRDDNELIGVAWSKDAMKAAQRSAL